MTELPYRIAVLCYLRDREDRWLLLHRRRPPNKDLYSPIGGKLETAVGESPTACALREIEEEAGLQLTAGQIHLTGIISEAGFDDRMHWLMFLYEVSKPVKVREGQIGEGTLEWHSRDAIEKRLTIPLTDRLVIWPLFWRYRGRFFMAHLDCAGGKLEWRIEQPSEDAMA
ncbi:MAG: NUDIX domain-containing protein, partial [Phycisphaeraceae bacterium]|nr:NUDIX domain-containing protein [Phycisphaeraceae bacterium]